MFRLSGCSADTTVAMCIAKGWAVGLACSGCRHRATLDLARLAELPAAATLGQIAERGSCSECGGREGLLYTSNAPRRGGHSA